jgi:hypothetical protein
LSRLEKSATPRQQRSPILVFLSAIIALQVVILTVGVLIYLQLRGGSQTASGTTNGKPSSPPVVQASQRLGAIAGGEAYVEDGNLTSGWIDQYGPNDHLDKVDGLMLSNNVIGLVTGNGEFMIKKGQVNAAWVDEYGPNLHTPAAVGAAVYSDPADSGNDRIAVWDTSGELLVKQGDLSKGWTDVFGPKLNQAQTAAGMLSGDLVGVVTAGGDFLVKQGALTTGWVEEYGPAVKTDAPCQARGSRLWVDRYLRPEAAAAGGDADGAVG